LQGPPGILRKTKQMATQQYFFKAMNGSLMFGRKPTLAEPKPPAIEVPFHNHIATVDDPAIQEMMNNHVRYGTKFWRIGADAPKPEPEVKYAEGQATTANETGLKEDKMRGKK